MKNNSLTKIFHKILAISSLAMIIYLIFGIFSDNAHIGSYIGFIILSSIILFLSLNILILLQMKEKDKKISLNAYSG